MFENWVKTATADELSALAIRLAEQLRTIQHEIKRREQSQKKIGRTHGG